ncbi:hydroxymethylbilane synthase [Treponema sp. TIM-1]|uniref:hydroxymethylbilane synthase n=1 Tax=Treponema sp. TIM-1 TaxID=2898417 RepID=UPI00397F28AA
MVREIRFGTRESDLAVAQTRLVMGIIAKAHPEFSLRLVTMKTRGDLYPELPLESGGAGGKDLFTGALEQALLKNEVDLCVHSLKDMAMEQDDLLPIVGMAKRGDPRDMLILPKAPETGNPENFTELSPGRALPLRQPGIAPVGCSSMRRRIQLLVRAPELTVAPIRGNVPTRLAKLDQGQFGALILAAAGIQRLGIKDRRGYYFSVRDMVPAAGQGVLALQGRRGEDYAFLDALRDPVTEEEAGTERRVIRTLGGGCHFPAAAFARISGTEIVIIAIYAAGAASPFYREEISGDRDRKFELAESLARRLLSGREEQ